MWRRPCLRIPLRKCSLRRRRLVTSRTLLKSHRFTRCSKISFATSSDLSAADVVSSARTLAEFFIQRREWDDASMSYAMCQTQMLFSSSSKPATKNCCALAE